MDNVIDILKELGYTCSDSGNYLKCNALYRGGSSSGSLTIYKNKNLVIDHVLGETFSCEDLIQKTLSLDSKEKVKEWLNNKHYILPAFNEIEAIVQVKKFSSEIADKFIPDYSYWVDSGISKETVEIFKGGYCNVGRFKNRQCLIIYNSKGEILGITGRDTTNTKKIKWVHAGNKGQWVWPAYLNSKVIKEKRQVILVESPRCVLKLWDCGITNVLCLFGTELSLGLINFFLRVGIQKVYIATNNEPDNHNRGNEAAAKIQNKLRKYFDYHVPVITLPPSKDFGEIKDNNLIKEWYNKVCVK